MIACNNSFHLKFNNKVITDCDIKICYGTSDFLTKADIADYTTIATNKFVCEKLPHEETAFTIKNWKNLTDTQKNYFGRGNPLYIYYIVGGIQTTGARFARIQECKVNYRGDTAVIRAISHLEFRTDQAKTNFSQISMMANLRNALADNFLGSNYYIDLLNSKTLELNNMAVARNFTDIGNYNGGITKAELAQNIITSCGGGFWFSYDGSKFVAKIREFSGSFYNFGNFVPFNLLNVFDDIDVENIPSYAIVSVNGYTLENNTQELGKYGLFTTTQSLLQLGYTWGEDINASISSVYITNSGTTINANSYDIFGKSLLATFLNVPAGGYDFVVKGQKVLPPVVEQTSGIAISAPCCSSTKTAQLGYVKDDAKLYYSITKQISFSCRIDPTIEPLDYIIVGDYYVCVEEIEIRFNGGFRGKITGKIINDIFKVEPPSLESKNIHNEYDYQFYINNPNPYDVVMTIEYSGGTETFVVAGYDDFTLDQDNAPFLFDSVYEYIHYELYDPIIAYFEIDGLDHRESTRTILLEGSANA